MTKTAKKKLKSLIVILVEVALVVVIIFSAISLFKNSYYESIFVSGSSMDPTFVGTGEKVDYGIIDGHDYAKRHLKRYQIVTTHFPGESKEASYKIKRVLVLPGETFKIYENNLYLKKGNKWSEPLDMPFSRNLTNDDGTPLIKSFRDGDEITLSSSEYFLAGDNWVHSYDSFYVGPIDYSCLTGVLVEMQGKCTLEDGKVKTLFPEAPRYFLGVDY